MWTVAAYRQTHSPCQLVWFEGWQPPGAEYAFIRGGSRRRLTLFPVKSFAASCGQVDVSQMMRRSSTTTALSHCIRTISLLHVCENVTSSTKPEVHNILHIENFAKFG